MATVRLARATVLALALSTTAWAQVLRVGPEFQVNTYTAGPQGDASVCRGGDGRFVVVWDSAGQDGDREGVYGQRYDASGTPQGGEFQVNGYTAGSQAIPDVACDDRGDFVVAWQSFGQDGSSYGVFVRRYDADGVPQGSEFPANAHTDSNQAHPRVASDRDGNFVVVWNSFGQDGDGNGQGVFARRFNHIGVPQGDEFQVNTYTTSNQDLADVASDPEGNFVVVWQSFGQDGDRSGVFGQRYDRAGVPLGGEFQVNTYTPDYQQSPKVSVDASGNFVIAWESRGQNGDVGIFARRYDAAGAPRGDEFQVNTPTAFPQAYLGLASHPEGGFVVAWTSVAPPQVAIVGRRYDAAGQPRGDQFQINTTVNLHLLPSLAAGAGGEFVAAWQGQGKDGSDYGVIGQRFVTPVTILGELFVVRDPAPPPAGAADRRKVVVVARERRSPDPLVGDPTVNGATLRVIADGTTGSDQTFTLPAGPGWRLIGSPPIGYRYSAASGPGAVRSLLVKRTAAGTFGMKVALLGRLGPIDVVPPDVGTEGGVILTIPGGASYCVDFGGPAGGILTSAGKKLFSVKRPAAEGCPP